MTTDELKDLQDKIAEAEKDKIKSEGALEQIEKVWENEYKCKNREEVEQKVEDLKTKINNLKEKLENYLVQIEKTMREIHG